MTSGTITVYTLGGASHAIELGEHSTVAHVCQQLAEAIGVTDDEMAMTLLHGSEELTSSTAKLADLGISDGATLTLAMSPLGIVGRHQRDKVPLVHRMVEQVDCMGMHLDAASSRLYFADHLQHRVGVIDLAHNTATVLATFDTFEQSPKDVVLHDGKLYCVTAGNPEAKYKDGQLVALSPHADAGSEGRTILLGNLEYPTAITADRAGNIFFMEAAGDTSFGGAKTLCKADFAEDGSCSKLVLMELPFSPKSLAIVDAEPHIFAIGASGGSSPGTGGEIWVVAPSSPSAATRVIKGVAANKGLAIDANGCLYCAGMANKAVPGLEAIPNFKAAALAVAASGQVDAGALVRVDIDDPEERTNCNSIAVDDGGRQIFYGPGRGGHGARQIFRAGE